MSNLDAITERISNTSKKLDMGKKHVWLDLGQTTELMGQLDKLQKLKRAE